MAAVVMPAALETLNQRTTQAPAQLPDMQLFKDHQHLNESFIEPLNPEGRQMYIEMAKNQDIWYPLSYSGFLFFSLLIMLKKLPDPIPILQVLLLLPVVALGADIFENFHTALLVDNFPETNPSHFRGYQLGFMAKWGSVIGSFAALILLLIVWLKQVYSIKPTGT